MDVSLLVSLVIWLLVLGIICGLLFWMVNEAPFVPPQFKQAIRFVIVVIVVLIAITFLLRLVPMPHIAMLLGNAAVA